MVMSGKVITVDHMLSDGRPRGFPGRCLYPSREVFLNSCCHTAFSTSYVTTSAVTKKIIDSMGLTERWDRMFERSQRNPFDRKDKTGVG